MEILETAALFGLVILIMGCALTYLAIAIHDMRKD